MTRSFSLPTHLVERKVAEALAEDLGDAGDITSLATIPEAQNGKAVIRARKNGVIAGMDAAICAFRLIDPGLQLEAKLSDGAIVKPSDELLTVFGTARAILSAERVALNFLGHLSGVATATNALVKEVAGTQAKIVCTRKTMPTMRAFQKHAVKCGGGYNHRFGLYDAVMIKDNHIAANGSITEALKAARDSLGHMVTIEIEIDTLDQLDEALSGGADVIMLDNMPPETMKIAVEKVNGRAVLEASGNITVETVRAVATSGVDVISSGWITHSAPNLDLGLDWL